MMRSLPRFNTIRAFKGRIRQVGYVESIVHHGDVKGFTITIAARGSFPNWLACTSYAGPNYTSYRAWLEARRCFFSGS